jgi:PEGA domain
MLAEAATPSLLALALAPRLSHAQTPPRAPAAAPTPTSSSKPQTRPPAAASSAAAASPPAALPASSTPPALAAPAPYKQHMDNGIKLYQDGNFLAAIVEFRAAYEAHPKASPLVNIALCYKAKFNYPKAIETLETALARHSDTMDASDKQAATDAIADMRALLAYASVELTPKQATLLVDGEEQAPGASNKPIPLGPGAHQIAARAEGYAPSEQIVTVASGERPTVKLALVPDKGWVIVRAVDPRQNIAIDQRAVGTGEWSGLLTPGLHVVQIYGGVGAPFAAQILVSAGKKLTVRPGGGNGGGGGTPIASFPGALGASSGITPTPIPLGPSTATPAPFGPPTTMPAPVPKPETPPLVRRGAYGFALGAILFPASHPPEFIDAQRDFGAEWGVRVGYQVNRIAGFDLTFQHGAITSTSSFDGSSYQAFANRLSVGLRLLTTGKMVRFATAFGGGPVFDELYFSLKPPLENRCSTNLMVPICPLHGSIAAVDAFMYLEGAVEIDLDRVLIDIGAELHIQSTGGIGAGGSIFAGNPLVHLGPAIRVGYRLW